MKKFLVLSMSLGWCGLVAFQVSQASYGWIESAFLALLLVAITIAGVCTASLRFVFGLKSGWMYIASLWIFVVSAFMVARSITDYQSRATLAAAEPIIKAVDRFTLDNDSYPISLKVLVPAYLTTIPKTKMGITGGEFDFYNTLYDSILTFRMPAGSRYSYSFSRRKWIYHD